LWQVSQSIGLNALSKAICAACAPGMLGYAAPAGAPPDGGLAWQEVQLSAVSGDAATWHVAHSGALETGDVPVTAWQIPQFGVNVAEVIEVWVVALTGTAWATSPGQSVLWKHPGGVPGGAGGVGGGIGERRPSRWHCAHTGACNASVSTCVRGLPGSHPPPLGAGSGWGGA